MQMHLVGKIVAVELRHCPAKHLNGPGNFVGKIHAQDYRNGNNQKIDTKQYHHNSAGAFR